MKSLMLGTQKINKTTFNLFMQKVRIEVWKVKQMRLERNLTVTKSKGKALQLLLIWLEL